MTSAAVYNQYWSTGGGGETFCGGIAEALAADGFDVTLLTPEDFDAEALGERLALDLSGCSQRIVTGGPHAVSEASADFDLFVNGSFLSTASNRAAAGIYVVHFPGRRPGDRRWAALAARGSRSTRASFRYHWGDGVYARDDGASRSVWTGHVAEIHVVVGGSRGTTVRLAFDHLRPPEAGPTPVEISVDGVMVQEVTVGVARSGALGRLTSRRATTVPLDLPAGSSTIGLRASTFVPAALGHGSDQRALGVPVRGLWRNSASTVIGASIAPDLHRALSRQPDPTPVGSYDLVVSNSTFTKQFVEDWWSVEESPVLYPPVVLRERNADKQTQIVSLGRFFASDSGHSKKQVELVTAFRRLRELGGADDWTLTLVGGCDESASGYLRDVRAAAAGLPVEFLVNASGVDRDRALARAAVFWHATGLDEDARAHPDRMEHFGISTVEAMSTGAVPVVFAGGGQTEIVVHGTSGFHFRTIDELVERTAMLLADENERRRIADGARARAEYFGLDAFRPRLRELVARARDPESDVTT